MKDYINSFGWVKYGRCGCKPPMDKYSNAAYPGWEVRVDDKQQLMQIRRNGSVVAQAGTINYTQVYETTIQ